MQLSSMTGFARTQKEFEYGQKKYRWVWEIKSVNAKGMDIKMRLPQWLDDIEIPLKEICSKTFARGTFSANLQIEKEEKQADIQINTKLLDVLIEKSKEIYQSHSDFLTKPTPTDFLKINNVIEFVENIPDEEELSSLKREILNSFENTASLLKADRQREGAKIAEVLKSILESIKQNVDTVSAIAEKMPEKMREKIASQIKEMANDVSISQDRLEQEALLLIMKADIQEEKDRLYAHIKTAFELLEDASPVGRRLDFLCQEFNREANTLCSKSADIEQTKCGMTLKALIEQFREQIQNME